MHISSLTLHSITVADPPLRSSYGLHAPYTLRTVVELTTDDGLTGISETYGGDGPVAALEAARSRVIGMDPFRLAGLHLELNQQVVASGDRSQTYLVPGENPADQHARTFAAIEFACLDIIGKAVGKPVCEVIGGRVRDEVPFSAYLFYKHSGGGGLGDDQHEDEYAKCSIHRRRCAKRCRW
jgi:glucarate dehydratase